MILSEQTDKIAPALVYVQTHAGAALKQASNPAFKSKYADLSACWDAVRDPLAQAKIAVIQEAVLTEVGVAVTTRLMHESGQWLQTEPLVIPLGAKRDAHAVGSCVSYGKRYSLSAALGIVADDDDGNAAAGRGPAPVAAPVVRTPDAEAYATWKDDLAAVAGEGLESLKEAWQSSPLEFRTHVMQADKAWWTALKAKAEAR